jgi:hypothetical protein
VEMPFQGTADSDQLATMTRALEDHCLRSGIPSGSPEHQDLASRVMFLFSSGITDLEELKKALASDSA